MKSFGILARIGIAIIALFTLPSLFLGRRSADPSNSAAEPPHRKRLIVRTFLTTIVGGLLLAAAGGLLLMASGFYNIAANKPHLAPVRWLLSTGRTRSVEFHSRGIQISPLKDPALATHGLVLYRENCLMCHGAPGVEPQQMGRGINPTPPPLVTAVHNWTDAQMYWIFVNGLKMSGMPGFAVRLSEADRLALLLFLRKLPLLSPAELRDVAVATDLGMERLAASLISDDDRGFSQLDRHGNSERGRELLRNYGCVACHTIPSLSHTRVGPPLTNFAERQYLAGSIVNTPADLVAWIVNPQQFKPNTAMPNLNVQPQEALDMGAYLYNFGDQKRLNGLRQTVMR